MISFYFFSYFIFFLLANLATKKRLKKRGQIAPTLASKTRASENSALNTQNNSIIIDEGKLSLIEAGLSISHVRQTNSIEECPDKEASKQEEDMEDEDTNVKDTQVSSAEAVSSRVEGKPERNDPTKKSFSEKIIQYISSKMNQISPDPIHQLEILQGGDDVNLPMTTEIDNV